MKLICMNLIVRVITCIIAATLFSVAVQGQDLPNSNFSKAAVGGAWSEPVGVAFSKTGSRLFVWEKGGKVFVMNRVGTTSSYTRQATAVLDISPEVGNWRDHGMLGFALDPNFDVNGLIYVMYVVDRHHLIYAGTGTYNAATNDYYKATIGRITCYKTVTTNGNLVVQASSRTILVGETKSTGIPILHESHGIGSLAFAADGTLLASAGDAASYNTVDLGSLAETYYTQALTDGIIRSNENVGALRSQMINSHNGKLLRIDPANGNGVSSNPFYQSATPRSARSRMWAMGFRNPFRFSVKPNTGSNNPATGDLGEIYVGDVGWDKYEELNVVKAKATNCGWPILEGVSWQSGYAAATTLNRDETNPLYGGSCTQQYFQFRQLIRQANISNNTNVYNPCNGSTVITSTAPARFLHRPPVLDWGHYVDSARVPYYDGNTLKVAQIGSAASGVTGSPFSGSSVVGGIWYTGTLFPSMYQNTYFMADYGGGWIKNVTMLSVDKVQAVRNFSTSGFGAVVSMAENPADGSIFCADIGTNEVIRIGYGGNKPPVIKMASNKTYGPAPLTVSFNSTGTVDPEGGTLTYSWNFGDGTALSTAANPGNHIFTVGNSNPRKFVVVLTVKDNANNTSIDSIIISANNTPPVVNITSPVKNSFYRLGADTAYQLKATVTDAQHAASALSYQWQVALRHNSHQHAEPINTTPLTSAVISRIGCNGDTYYWFVKLTVTDAAGLSTTDSSKIYPQCGGPLPVTLNSINAVADGPANVLRWVTSSEINLKFFEIERSYDGINFEKVAVVNAARGAGYGNYEWRDNNHDAGYNYYRLRMVDFSGYEKYSGVVKVFSGAIAAEELQVSPNPARDHTVLNVQLAASGKVQLRVTDANGRLVREQEADGRAGANKFFINALRTWAPGIYFVELQQGALKKSGKFVKE